MPRPPVLPTIDWRAVFASGADFAAWIEAAENAEHRARMQQALAELPLHPATAAFVKALPRTVHVVAIAEDWCGDVVRHVPPLMRLAQAGDRIKVRFIAREQHKDVFARFLTNGGEAIPKFVFLSDAFVECGNWGPMPEEHRRLIARGKASGKGGDARKRVSALYEADPRCESTTRELVALLETASALEP